MKRLTKKGLIALICTLAAVLILFVGIMVYFFGATFPTFNKLKQKEFAIPGLDSKFVPQGLAYDESNGKFLVSGYMQNDAPSRVYVVDKDSGEIDKYITLVEKTEVYKGHASGITIYDRTIWVAGDGYIYRFGVDQLYGAENEAAIELTDSFKTGNGADFITVYNDKLIVGEYYRRGVKVDKTHKISTSSSSYSALAFAFPIDQSSKYGISSVFPSYGISLPNEVQGLTFNSDGDIVLSCSYGIFKSKIKIYENVLTGSTSVQTTINGITLNCYVLSKDKCKKTIKAPCMSEEIQLVDDRVFIMFESGSSKFNWFARTRLKNVYSIGI